MFTFMCIAVLGTVADGPGTLVIGLGADAADPSQLQQREAWERQHNQTIVSHAQLLQAIWGTPAPAPFVSAGAELKLEQAREREADFETAAANNLRQEVVQAYEHAPRPSAKARALTALAMQEMAAALLAEGRRKAAEALASKIGRRFPEHAPDPRRFPPSVIELLKAGRDRANAGAKGRINVRSGEGEVFVDGRSLGQSRGRVVRSLPVGTYRVWLVQGDEISLPRAVTIEENQVAEVTIEAELDRCLSLTPALHLTCPDSWERDMTALANLTGAKRVVGMLSPDAPPPVSAQNGVLVVEPALGAAADAAKQANTEPAEVSTTVDTTALASFSPLYLIPFGGAQFAQARPVFGSIYLATVVGLGAWFVAATIQHAEITSSGFVESEPEYRLYRGLSAGLFFGALGATVIEAIIYGLIVGE